MKTSQLLNAARDGVVCTLTGAQTALVRILNDPKATLTATEASRLFCFVTTTPEGKVLAKSGPEWWCATALARSRVDSGLFNLTLATALQATTIPE